MWTPNTKFLSNCSELIKRIPKFQNVSCDPSQAAVEVNFSSTDKGLHVQNLELIKVMEGPKF